MITVTIPQAPNRFEPATFSAYMDAYTQALQTFAAQLSAMAVTANTEALATVASSKGAAELYTKAVALYPTPPSMVGGNTNSFTVSSSQLIPYGAYVTAIADNGVNLTDLNAITALTGTVAFSVPGTATLSFIVDRAQMMTPSTGSWYIMTDLSVTYGAYYKAFKNPGDTGTINLMQQANNSVVELDLAGNITSMFNSFLLPEGFTITVIPNSACNLLHNDVTCYLQNITLYNLTQVYPEDRIKVSKKAGVVYVVVEPASGLPLYTGGFQRGIFAFGGTATPIATSNYINEHGSISADTSILGTAKLGAAGGNYGVGTAIIGYGYTTVYVATYARVTDSGVVSSELAAIGTPRAYLGCASYGRDKCVFGFGTASVPTGLLNSNYVSNTGALATDTTITGSARWAVAASSYGQDKAFFAHGSDSTYTNTGRINLISNTGVFATETTNALADIRASAVAVTYGGDRAIIVTRGILAGHSGLSSTSYMSNLGIISLVSGTVTVSGYSYMASSPFGGDKGLLGYGSPPGSSSWFARYFTVSNTGVTSSEIAGAGTPRSAIAGAGYGF